MTKPCFEYELPAEAATPEGIAGANAGCEAVGSVTSSCSTDNTVGICDYQTGGMYDTAAYFYAGGWVDGSNVGDICNGLGGTLR